MSGTIIRKGNDQTLELIKQVQSEKVIAVLTRILPRNLSANKLARQTVTLIRKSERLGQCDPVSVLGGLIQAAELNLELSGVLGHCWLIPRENRRRGCWEATFQMGYKGYRELALRSGRVSGLQPRVVYQGETFEVSYGTHPYITHVPGVQGEGRGEDPQALGYYCAAFMRGDTQASDFEYMTIEEIRRWRARYSATKPGPNDRSAWATHFNAMAMKTVTGIVARRLPLSSEAQGLLDVESPTDTEALRFTDRAVESLEELGMMAGGEEEMAPETTTRTEDAQSDAQGGAAGQVGQLPPPPKN